MLASDPILFIIVVGQLVGRVVKVRLVSDRFRRYLHTTNVNVSKHLSMVFTGQSDVFVRCLIP